jgi:hypothetical protein
MDIDRHASSKTWKTVDPASSLRATTWEVAMQDEVNQEQSVTLVLTPSEALVLFELLSRWDLLSRAAETDAASVPLEHQAEYRVLWDILAVLESTLVEPFMSDYQGQLDRARELVRDEQE